MFLVLNLLGSFSLSFIPKLQVSPNFGLLSGYPLTSTASMQPACVHSPSPIAASELPGPHSSLGSAWIWQTLNEMKDYKNWLSKKVAGGMRGGERTGCVSTPLSCHCRAILWCQPDLVSSQPVCLKALCLWLFRWPVLLEISLGTGTESQTSLSLPMVVSLAPATSVRWTYEQHCPSPERHWLMSVSSHHVQCPLHFLCCKTGPIFTILLLLSKRARTVPL